jgi:hypothetical protein
MSNLNEATYADRLLADQREFAALDALDTLTDAQAYTARLDAEHAAFNALDDLDSKAKA